jgi:hypothetical protein
MTIWITHEQAQALDELGRFLLWFGPALILSPFVWMEFEMWRAKRDASSGEAKRKQVGVSR